MAPIKILASQAQSNNLYKNIRTKADILIVLMIITIYVVSLTE